MLKLGIMKLDDRDRVSGFIEFARYGSGAIAMIVREKNTPDSECVCKPTVSLVSFDVDRYLAIDECYVKTWSENEGVFEQMVRLGMVTHVPTKDFQIREGVVARCAKLGPDALAEFYRQEKEGN